MLGEGWEPEGGEKGWSDWHWFKIRSGRFLHLVFLTEKPVHYRGHFVDKRMQPCLGPDCETCRQGVGDQLRYVFTVAERLERRIGFFEVSRSVALQIQDFSVRHEGLPGMVLCIGKASFSKNSRMEVEYVDDVEPPWYRTVAVPDARDALVSTWRKAGFGVPAACDSKTSDRQSSVDREVDAEAESARFRRPLSKG